MNLAKYFTPMEATPEIKGFLLLRGCVVCATVLFFALPGPARAGKYDIEHFVSGEFKGTLSWDSISAVEDDTYRFGGSAAWFLLNGLALGYEQQFVLPRGRQIESRSWGVIRLVPFRHWPLAPFVSLRLGYYYQPDSGAAATGLACGFVAFLSRHLAFEASFRNQLVFHPQTEMEYQQEVVTRFALYF